jgi:long-chain acyl-CoA synthetase
MYARFASLTKECSAANVLFDKETRVTRADLLRRADALANELTAARIAERTLVGVQMPNSVDFVAAILAIAKVDAVAVLLDREANAAEVSSIVEQFGVAGILRADVIPSVARDLGERAARLTKFDLGATQSPRSLATLGMTRGRIIKLTSGSTGRPKGIVVSEENLFADADHICRTMDIRPDDINFGAIPLSHSYGFSNLVMPLITQGTAVVISNDYLPQSIIDRCNAHRCTVMPGIPMVFDHLASTPQEDGHFETVRTFISAGAPLPASVSRRFRDRFGIPIHSFYGCSECGGITYDREGAAAERGNVGAAMEGVTLEPTSSRLSIHSSAVALGYLHDANTFEPFENGHFVADDLVSIGESGDVTLTGRASELINTAGKKVNPREVENVLLQMEGVRQAKVYGEAAGARGEVVAAAVVASPDVTREAIRSFCREHLASHKVPRIVKLIDQIPVDDRGKVRRSALAEL